VERRSANRSLLRWGYVLILLGALTGLAGALLARHGGRHTAALAGVVCGMFLVLLGLSWRHLNLSLPAGRILESLARTATYGAWATALLTWIWGVGRGPADLAAPGPAAWQRLALVILAGAVSVAGIGTLGMVVMAIRPRPRPPGAA